MNNYFKDCKTKEDLMRTKTRLIEEVRATGKDVEAKISIINNQYSKSYMALRSASQSDIKDVPVTYISESLKIPELAEGYTLVFGKVKSNQIILQKDGTIWL